MRIVVSKKALISIEEIEAFYYEIRPSLAKHFKKELSTAFKSLKIFCKYPIRYDAVRVYKVHRFRT
jgi:plasmid stabilization system protein ParE